MNKPAFPTFVFAFAAAFFAVTACVPVEDAAGESASKEWLVAYDQNGRGSDGWGVALGGDNSIYVVGTASAEDQAGNVMVAKYAADGGQQWIDTYNGSANTMDTGSDIAVAPTGEIYAVGTVVERRGFGIWIRKYLADGTVLWTKTYIQNGESAYGVAVAPDGSVYVTGDTRIGDDSALLLLKYSAGGRRLWTQTLAQASNGHGVVVAPSGRIYVTGAKVIGGHAGIFVAKYSPRGRLLSSFGYRCPGSYTCVGYGIAVDARENIYVAGDASDIQGSGDIWLGRFSNAGGLAWNKTINGPAGKDDFAYDLVLASDDKLYLTGNVTARGQDKNPWIAKYSRTGRKIWTLSYSDKSEVGNDIAVDSTGGVYVAGYREGKDGFYMLLLKLRQTD